MFWNQALADPNVWMRPGINSSWGPLRHLVEHGIVLFWDTKIVCLC
jgi:hypothetical protein